MNNAALNVLIDPNVSYIPEVAKTKENLAYAKFEQDMKAGKPRKSPANKMRDMKRDELNVLRLSIMASGLLDGVTIDESGRIVDGWHRVNACLQLHTSGDAELLDRSSVARVVPSGMKANDAKVLELGLNGARRHLTNADLLEQALDAGILEKKVTGKSPRVKAAAVNLRKMVMDQFICQKSAAAEKIADARGFLNMDLEEGHRYTEAEARKIIKHIGVMEDAKRKGEAKATVSQGKRKVRATAATVKADAATEKLIEKEVKRRIPMAAPTLNVSAIVAWIKADAKPAELKRVFNAAKGQMGQ